MRWRIFLIHCRLHSIQAHILKRDIICSEFSTHVLFTYLQSICTDLISTTGPGTNLCKILTLVLPGSSIGSAPFCPCHRKSTFWSFRFFFFFFFFLTKRFIFWLVHLNIYERKNDEQGIYKEMNSFFALFWKENIYKTPWFHWENLHIFITVLIFENLRISTLSKLKKINTKYSWNFESYILQNSRVSCLRFIQVRFLYSLVKCLGY